MASISILPIPTTPDRSGKDKSFQNALAEHGRTTFFGTFKSFLPLKAKSGKYLTGLDENTPEINALMEPDRQNEKDRIIAKRQRLEDATGLKLGPRDDYYSKAWLRDDRDGKSVATPILLGDQKQDFNLSDAFQEIAFLWLTQWSNFIAPSLDVFSRGKTNGGGQDIKWYISNPEAEAEVIYNDNKDIVKALTKWEEMSQEKRKKVGKLLGLPIMDTDSEKLIFNQGIKFINGGQIQGGEYKGQNAVGTFNRIANLSDDMVEVKALVRDAINLRVYNKKGNKIWEGADTFISETEADLVKSLLGKANQEGLLALTIKVNDKKKLKQLAS